MVSIVLVLDRRVWNLLLDSLRADRTFVGFEGGTLPIFTAFPYMAPRRYAADGSHFVSIVVLRGPFLRGVRRPQHATTGITAARVRSVEARQLHG